MDMGTAFDWTTDPGSAGASIAGAAHPQSYNDLIWAVGTVWAGFMEKLGEALNDGGYHDITAEEALRLYGLTRGEQLCVTAPSTDARSLRRTSQLHRNGYLARDDANGSTVVTALGIAAVALMDDVMDAQACAIAADSPIHSNQFGTLTRAMQLLGRWIKRAA